MLQAAARISEGQVPYRDFYANYGPGQYYLIAVLDLGFGPSLLSWRILRVALDAGVALLAYLIARRDCSQPLALGAWLAVAAAMAYPSIPHPNPTGLALAFGALLLASRSPGAAGALAAVTVAFRFDLGVAAIAAVGLAALASGGPRAGARALLVAAAVAAATVLPFVIVAPGELWDQTLGFALDEQSLQRLPLPGAWEGGFEPNKVLQHYFAYVLLGATAAWLVVATRRRLPLRLWAPAPLAAAGVAYLVARADVFHLVPLAAVLPILLATAAEGERRAGHRVSMALLSVLIAAIVLHGLDLKRIQLLDPPPQQAIDVGVADGVKAPREEARALRDVTRYLASTAPPGEPIFVANPRHDLVKVGNPLLYVLAGRPNPTRYDVFQPGVITSAPVQREVVADLERARPELIVRWLSPVADDPEPNGAGRSSGVRILDRYLAERYSETRRFGDYAVLERSDR